MKLRVLSMFLLCAPVWTAAAALDFGRMKADEVAVYAQELDSGKVVAEHRADALINPASTMKLVTAFAAFSALGKDYRWTTELKSGGSIQNDTLNGDIYWVGSGDPVLDQDGLIAMQQALRDKGIRKISGQLVLDRSIWHDSGSAADFDSDAKETFAIAPDPNMLAYKVVWLKLERNPLGDVEITTNPPLPDVPLENQVTLSDSTQACKALKNHLNARYSNGVLQVSGRLPPSCIGQEMFVNMLNTQEFAAKSFINQWRKAGGEISNGIRIAKAAADMPVLARHQAKPLSAVLSDMNKHSNNLIARSVFLKLGGAGGNTTAQAEAALKRELAAAGIDTAPLILENGSGLSRRERVSVHMLAQLLERAYFAPFSQEFIATLPVAGVDGTMKSRFAYLAGHQHLRLKTGTLKDVRALAGYWLGDKPMLVVAVVNSPKAAAYMTDLDKMVEKIVRPGGESWINAAQACEQRYAA